jgi:hypothetical protein
MIHVVLPPHLRTLARTGKDVELQVEGDITQRTVLDALEAQFPMLRGTIRDQQTHKRRPMVRFFVNEQDISHDSPDIALPENVVQGREPFWILGAISGG